jgi:hypothetical protein
MKNIWLAIKSGRVRIAEQDEKYSGVKAGDIIYHTFERCCGGFTGHDVNITQEAKACGMSIEDMIALYQSLDYDPMTDTVGSD